MKSTMRFEIDIEDKQQLVDTYSKEEIVAILTKIVSYIPKASSITINVIIASGAGTTNTIEVKNAR